MFLKRASTEIEARVSLSPPPCATAASGLFELLLEVEVEIDGYKDW